MNNRGKIRVNKAAIGYWWSIVGHFGPGAGGWRPTKEGAIRAGRKFKAKDERCSQMYYNPDWLVD